MVLILALTLSAQAQDEATSSDSNGVPPRGGMGTVSIKTNPEKAVVYLGGTKLGLSPIDTVFASGRHTLTIMLNGEELITERVNVWPDRTLEIEKTLKLPYGSVALHIKPEKANAQVTVDGEPVGGGAGLVRINRLEAGTRSIRVKYGKKVRDIHVDVLPEETVDVNVDFGK